MRIRTVLLAAALSAGVVVADVDARGTGRILGARALRTCAAAGPFWPTMTLAVSGTTAWVACKENAQVVRMNVPKGRTTATVRLGARVIAVAVGLRSVWALDTASTLYRIDPRT